MQALLRGVAGAELALALAAPAVAQGWQCRAPSVLPRSEAVSRLPDAPVRRVPIGGYILSLSWSPEYCRTRKTSMRDALQCSGRMGEFGFILHGLWPQGRGRAPWPQYCRPVSAVPSATLRANICHMPSVSLVNHEWAKHGSCMAWRPSAYLRASRVLFDALEFPDMDRLSRRDPTAKDVRDAFVMANPGLEPEAIELRRNWRGWLTDVRLCLDRRFRTTGCARRTMPDDTDIKIWRGG